MARGAALAAALAVALLLVSGASGAGTQTPRTGGTLVIAQSRHLEPACLNPFFESCSPDFLNRVLGGAFTVTPDATFRPDLARAEIAATEPFTLLYRIRPEARWSDGTPVTARDFEFTHRMILRLRPEFDVTQREHLDRVRSVRALDVKTVRVVLRDRYPDWRFFFSWVLPRHALAGENLEEVWRVGIDHPRTRASIGSGPFLVERFERGKQLVLRRNPRYWGPHRAYLDRIVIRYLDPQDAAEALRRGEVDMITPGPGVLQAEAHELRRGAAPGVTVHVVRDTGWEHFDIRIGPGGHPALKLRRVRQALAYGVDRQAIARAVGALVGSATQPLDSVVFLTNSRYYEPSWKNYRYRPDQAVRLLEQAGCRRGTDRIYVCAGERLSLRIFTVGVERRRLTVELARDQLRAVGIEVVLQYVPPGQLTTSLERRDFDLFLFGFFGGASTAGPYDVFGCQRPFNYTGYCDRLLTRDLRQARRILDRGRRVELLNSVDARLATAVPAIPLFQTTSPFAHRTTVRGVVTNGVGSFMWNAEDWWLAR